MKHNGMTKERAMRVPEFEFEFDDETNQLCGLVYWLGDGRRTTNRRYVNLANDRSFDELFYNQVHSKMNPNHLSTTPHHAFAS